MLVEESVLRHQFGDAVAMAGQLGHLLSVMSLPAVSLGVIPVSVPRTLWAIETFNVFDDARVHVELLTAQMTVTAPGEVRDYLKAFAELQQLAVYGTRARSLIVSAIEALG